ncbi:MAG: DUF5050 domain-containing protein [Clostridia bacterium]|nr:DUF5050 domain-containing protein [Clostridia bacterium]
MKKIIAIFLVSMSLVLMCCSCSKTKNPQPSIDVTTQTKKGNTNGNLLASGLFAQQGSEVYFSSNGLYRINETGSEWAQLYSADVSSINITDGNLYCLVSADNGDRIISKITGETGEAVKIVDGDVQSFIIVDNNIYYSSKALGGIFKTDLTGSNPTKLYDAYAWNISYDNGFLYFVAEDSKYNIHRIDKNGENHVIVYDGEALSATVDNGTVYFTVIAQTGSGIYRIGESGKAELLVEAIPMRINVLNGYLYYTTAEGLFKYDTAKGGNTIKLAEGSINHIYTGGGYIYYTLNNAGTSKLYRIKPDATGAELFLTLVSE